MPAGRGDDDRLPAAFLPMGAVRPKTGQRAVNQAGVGLGGGIVADAQAVGYAGAEVFNQHIGPMHQVLRLPESGGGFQVQFHRAFAAVPSGESGFGAGRVAAGTFDLDDVGALLRQQHRQ